MTPDQVVSRYIEEMNAWEVCARERNQKFRDGEMKYADVKSVSLKEMEHIHKRHISSNVQMRGFRFAEPPDYDPKSESPVSTELVSDSAAKVFTKQSSGLKQELIYHLRLEDGDWKITEKFIVGHDGKPFRANL